MEYVVTMTTRGFGFQRLRRSQDITSAPPLAASIFLDVLNVFLFSLATFSSEKEV